MTRHSRTHHPSRCKRCGARCLEPKLELRRVCKYCKREFNRTCLYEHQKWHCPKNPNRVKRTFTKKQCPQCKKMIHEKSFSRHVKSHTKKKVSWPLFKLFKWVSWYLIDWGVWMRLEASGSGWWVVWMHKEALVFCGVCIHYKKRWFFVKCAFTTKERGPKYLTPL